MGRENFKNTNRDLLRWGEKPSKLQIETYYDGERNLQNYKQKLTKIGRETFKITNINLLRWGEKPSKLQIETY